MAFPRHGSSLAPNFANISKLMLAQAHERTPSTTDPGAEPKHRVCERVVDGDTVVLNGGEKVRYIGIDTPETKHPGKPVQRMGPAAAEAKSVASIRAEELRGTTAAALSHSA